MKNIFARAIAYLTALCSILFIAVWYFDAFPSEYVKLTEKRGFREDAFKEEFGAIAYRAHDFGCDKDGLANKIYFDFSEISSFEKQEIKRRISEMFAWSTRHFTCCTPCLKKGKISKFTTDVHVLEKGVLRAKGRTTYNIDWSGKSYGILLYAQERHMPDAEFFDQMANLVLNDNEVKMSNEIAASQNEADQLYVWRDGAVNRNKNYNCSFRNAYQDSLSRSCDVYETLIGSSCVAHYRHSSPILALDGSVIIRKKFKIYYREKPSIEQARQDVCKGTLHDTDLCRSKIKITCTNNRF